MDAARTTIDALLSPHKKCYTVPPYQRGYAWETQQVEELWNDLEAADGGQHFLGSIVLQFASESEPQIIDGQQRLATITVLLCCIRDHYDQLGLAENVAGLHYAYVQTRRPGDSGGFKLRLSDADSDFFEQYIQRKPGDEQRRELERRERPKRGSHRLLWSARCFLFDKIGEKLQLGATTEDKVAVLEQLEQQITEQIRLIQILVDDDDEAFQIFETLNDRGLSLSQADLLKNYLCMKWRAETSDRGDVAQLVVRWDEAMQPLSERADMSVFLRHYLLSVVDDDKVRKDMIYKIFRQHTKQERAQRVVETLAIHAGHYGTFANPALLEDPATARILGNLLALRATQCYSLLLAAREQLGPEEFRRMAHMAEVLTVRHSTICNRSARDLERLYHACALRLRAAAGEYEAVLRDLAKFAPDDDVVKASFAGMRRSRTTEFLLRRIEESCAVEERVLEPQKVHIEHILPQSLPDQWLTYLAATKEEAQEYVEKLGNLTLLGAEYNKQASNYAFERKKTQYYPRSNIQMTRELLERETWSFDAIEQRQAEVAELACRTWDAARV